MPADLRIVEAGRPHASRSDEIRAVELATEGIGVLYQLEHVAAGALHPNELEGLDRARYLLGRIVRRLCVRDRRRV